MSRGDRGGQGGWVAMNVYEDVPKSGVVCLVVKNHKSLLLNLSGLRILFPIR